MYKSLRKKMSRKKMPNHSKLVTIQREGAPDLTIDLGQNTFRINDKTTTAKEGHFRTPDNRSPAHALMRPAGQTGGIPWGRFIRSNGPDGLSYLLLGTTLQITHTAQDGMVSHCRFKTVALRRSQRAQEGRV